MRRFVFRRPRECPVSSLPSVSVGFFLDVGSGQVTVMPLLLPTPEPAVRLEGFHRTHFWDNLKGKTVLQFEKPTTSHVDENPRRTRVAPVPLACRGTVPGHARPSSPRWFPSLCSHSVCKQSSQSKKTLPESMRHNGGCTPLHPQRPPGSPACRR